MIAVGDHVGMEIAFVVFVLVVGLMALVRGADSRIDDVERRRHYLG
jgi:hypothetical protein